MAKTKDELKALFSTGKTPTGEDFAELIEGVVGPEGPKGTTGAAGKDGAVGPKGETGANGGAGKDGFGTKAEYDAIIARLVELEKP